MEKLTTFAGFYKILKINLLGDLTCPPPPTITPRSLKFSKTLTSYSKTRKEINYGS